VDSTSVKVTASADVPTGFMSAVSVDKVTVSVTATAVKSYEGPRPCLFALSPTAAPGINFSGQGNFTGKGCMVQSNSTSASALSFSGNTVAMAERFCAVGGVTNPSVSTPPAKSNCEAMQDPFATLAPPPVGACSFLNLLIAASQTLTLNPGTYCGGLNIRGTVTLNPGVYVIKDGTFLISGQATVRGEGVMFYLTGTNAGFSFAGTSTIDLAAARSGPYGGILIYQDRLSNVGFTNTVAGSTQDKLIGAIYTPTQKVTLTGNNNFGENSPFMPVIANTIEITGSAVIKLDMKWAQLPFDLPKSVGGARLAY